MLSADSDGELAVVDGGGHGELDLVDHILGEDEVVTVSIIEYVEFRKRPMFEMGPFKIVRAAADGRRALARACSETRCMVVRNPIDADVCVVV
jgi:hypothetical protein